MIESRLDAATDGTGGGYGKYPGLTVEAVAERFRFLAEEGQGRSARAILRIVHEQTEARGRLGSQRLVVALSAGVAAVLFVLRLVVSPETRDQFTTPLDVALGATALFGLGAATLHRTTVRGEAQVREIRRLALVALGLLTQREGFVPKPLEREHRASLGDLRRVDRETWTRVNKILLSPP